MKTEPLRVDMQCFEAMEALRKVKAIADIMMLAELSGHTAELMEETLGSLGALLNDIANGPLKAHDTPAKRKLKAVAA